MKAAGLKQNLRTQARSAEVLALREKQVIDTQKQTCKDIASYCYGQEAYLDKSLKKLG